MESEWIINLASTLYFLQQLGIYMQVQRVLIGGYIAARGYKVVTKRGSGAILKYGNLSSRENNYSNYHDIN